MVEIFKTNVTNLDQASMLIDKINRINCDYKANFDLEDCDKILRVASETGTVQSTSLINLLKEFGFSAEILP